MTWQSQWLRRYALVTSGKGSIHCQRLSSTSHFLRQTIYICLSSPYWNSRCTFKAPPEWLKQTSVSTCPNSARDPPRKLLFLQGFLSGGGIITHSGKPKPGRHLWHHPCPSYPQARQPQKWVLWFLNYSVIPYASSCHLHSQHLGLSYQNNLSPLWLKHLIISQNLVFCSPHSPRCRNQRKYIKL